MRQIGFSDMVILNKVDLVGEQEPQQVRDSIDQRLNRVRVVESVHCDVPLEILLGVGRFDPQQLAATEDGHHRAHTDHGQSFSTWSHETDQPLSLDSLREMGKRKLPGSVYRCKRVVYSVEVPEQRAIVQVVGRRTDVAVDEVWGDRTPSTRIVAIGLYQTLDADMLTGLFDACLAEPSNATRNVEARLELSSDISATQNSVSMLQMDPRSCGSRP